MAYVIPSAALNRSAMLREELREYLNPIYDLERLISRVTYQTANPRDLTAFKSSLEMLPHIHALLGEFDAALLLEIQSELDVLEDIYQLVDASIKEDPPISIRDGGIIKEGYDEEIDKLRHAKTEGKTWLMELETKEREKTGIKNLRIWYNKVFGYYLEVTNSYQNLVPDYYTRKQKIGRAHV